jgi:hypothetical protein
MDGVQPNRRSPYFATASYVPINLPEPVLTLIMLFVRESARATVDRACCAVMPAEADGAQAGSNAAFHADLMRGIGAVSIGWRRLAKESRMRDGLAWLRVSGACTAAECLSAFPCARSIRINGRARPRDVVAVLASRSVEQLALEHNDAVRNCRSLGRCVGLRTLQLNACFRLSDVCALSLLVGLHSLHFIQCMKLWDLRPLSTLVGLRTLQLSGCNRLTDVRPLSALVGLNKLGLLGCTQLRDVRALSSLVGLSTLDLNGTSPTTTRTCTSTHTHE